MKVSDHNTGYYSMNLQDKFTELKSRHEGAFIAYVCADIIELGRSNLHMLLRMSKGGRERRTRGCCCDQSVWQGGKDVDLVSRREGFA